MSNRIKKIIMTCGALMLTFAMMIMGVLAATSHTLGVTTTVSFTATAIDGNLTGYVSGNSGTAIPNSSYEVTPSSGDFDWNIGALSFNVVDGIAEPIYIDFEFENTGGTDAYMSFPTVGDLTASDDNLLVESYFYDTARNTTTQTGATYVNFADRVVAESIILSTHTSTFSLKLSVIDQTENITNLALDFGVNLVNVNQEYTITYNNIANGMGNDPLNASTYKLSGEEKLFYAPKLTGTVDGTSLTTSGDFVGWFDAASNGNQVMSISAGEIGNKTLYARYNSTSKPLFTYTITDAENHYCSITPTGTGKSLTKIVIPSKVVVGDIEYSVTSTERLAFLRCSATAISIPNSVTSFGDFSFNQCYYLTSITIPGSVTSIGNDLFRECLSLTSVRIQEGVTSIGYSSFSLCGNLTSVTFEDTSKTWTANGVTINVDNPTTNATNLKSTYMNYTWTKNV